MSTAQLQRDSGFSYRPLSREDGEALRADLVALKKELDEFERSRRARTSWLTRFLRYRKR